MYVPTNLPEIMESYPKSDQNRPRAEEQLRAIKIMILLNCAIPNHSIKSA